MGLALGFGLWAFGVKGLGGGGLWVEDERKLFQESFRVTVFALPDMTT